MKRIILIAVLLMTLAVLAAPAGAQGGDDLKCDEAQISAAITQAQADLEVAASLEGMEALAQIARVQAALAALDYSCKTVVSEGTRLNPVPLGVSVQLGDYGLVRLVEFIDPYESTGNVYGLEEGYRLVAVKFEYDCQLADPNETCRGDDFWINAMITPESKILSNGAAVAVSDGSPWLYNAEGFSGTMLEGYSFAAVPIGEAVATVRISGFTMGFDEAYLSVAE